MRRRHLLLRHHYRSAAPSGAAQRPAARRGTVHSFTPSREAPRLPRLRRPFPGRTLGTACPISAPLQETRFFLRKISLLTPPHLATGFARTGKPPHKRMPALSGRRNIPAGCESLDGIDRTAGLRYPEPIPILTSGRAVTPATLWRLPCSFPAKRCCRFSLPP